MVKVDQEKCIGCGSCESVCPAVFELKDTPDGMKAQVKKGADTKKPCVKEAIDICPTDAII